MSVIWKVEITGSFFQTVMMSRGAQILMVGNQNENLCIWYKHDPAQPLESRHIEVYGTGHEIKDHKPGGELKFLGSVMFDNGMLVWHVFERVSIQI